MPYVTRESFTNEDRILEFSYENSASYNYSITEDFITANNNGDKEIPAGMFVCCDINSNTRYLPAFTLTQPINNSSNILTGYPVMQFQPGDVIYPIQAYIGATISGTFAVGESITFGIYFANSTVTRALPYPDTNEELLVEMANKVNSNFNINMKVTALASGDKLYVTLDDFTPPVGRLDLFTADTSATGSLTSFNSNTSDYFGYSVTPIGTVDSVDVDNNQIILTANAVGVELPIGAKVGSYYKFLLGIDPYQRNFRDQTNQAIAVYTKSSGVDVNKLPYFDSTIDDRLPLITFLNFLNRK